MNDAIPENINRLMHFTLLRYTETQEHLAKVFNAWPICWWLRAIKCGVYR